MAKKKRDQQGTKPEEQLGDNWVLPFSNLQIKIDEPPPPPPPPPPTKEELSREQLSREDKELLKAFGGDDPTAPSLERSDIKKKRERLTLSRERKGHGGKTVTLVRGLELLSELEKMELSGRIKTALGIGARFVEGILELQGDQRDRAAAWFEKENYAVKTV